MSTGKKLDPTLLRFASTDRQLEVLLAIQSEGSITKAAKKVGITRASVQSAYRAVKKRAALRGYAPEADLDQPLPEGMITKGVSTRRNEKGEKEQEWIKTTREGRDAEEADSLPDPKTVTKQSRLFDAEGNVTQHWVTEKPALVQQAQLWETFADELRQSIPRVSAIEGPPVTQENLCNVYTMTDCHMGMLAWHEEGGADWDIKIAERTLTAVFGDLVARSPDAKVGVVAQLGDFLHYDSLTAVTPTSGHILDADTRFEKLVRVAVRTLRRIVDMALAKHEHVYVLMAEGNHDMASSAWLRTLFAALYENEPRVTVNTSPKPYYCMTWGKVMLMWHHTHLSRIDSFPTVAASEFPKEWGQTEYRYGHGGDKHHRYSKEYAGMIVEQHTTLAARDAYAARGGWNSLRAAFGITYHREMGEVGRVQSSPQMVAE